MANILVQVPNGVGQIQVEVPEFKLDTKGRPAKGEDGKPVPFGERANQGAIHLRPGSTKILSQAELEHIRKKHPDVGRRLLVVRELSSESATSGPSATPDTPSASAPSVATLPGALPVETETKDDNGGAGRRKRSSNGG